MRGVWLGSYTFFPLYLYGVVAESSGIPSLEQTLAVKTVICLLPIGKTISLGNQRANYLDLKCGLRLRAPTARGVLL